MLPFLWGLKDTRASRSGTRMKMVISMVDVFADDFSELLQHEIDHLYGVLATDHLRDVKKIVSREEWEKQFGASDKNMIFST